MVSAPVGLPAPVGVKTTVMVQVAFGERGAVQVLVAENSPEAATLVTERGALPELVTVTVWAVLVTGVEVATVPAVTWIEDWVCPAGTEIVETARAGESLDRATVVSLADA